MSNLFEMEIVELLMVLVRIIILLVMWTALLSALFVPKIVKTFVNKWLIKNGHVPSVNYLPDKTDIPDIDNKQVDSETTNDDLNMSEQLEKIKNDRRDVLNKYNIDELRTMAKNFKEDGFKIAKYYNMDKPTLIAAIIETEYKITLEKSLDDVQNDIEKASVSGNDNVN